MEPARSVGGDFYDFFLIDPDRFAFLVGDVSGKGIPAALFMAVTRTLLRATAMQGTSSAACLSYVNNVLAKQSDGAMFVTLFYCILDTRTGDVDYCAAGHSAACVFSPHGGIRHAGDGGGLIAGLYDGAPYVAGQLRLQPGEGILLFTDGVTETFDAAGGMFGDARLEKALESLDASTVEEIVKGVTREVRTFQGAAAQSDDITVLAMRYLGSPAAQ
jgi:sigma-B regulation protein RsbU (phosphoserine phosphatase)